MSGVSWVVLMFDLDNQKDHTIVATFGHEPTLSERATIASGFVFGLEPEAQTKRWGTAVAKVPHTP